MPNNAYDVPHISKQLADHLKGEFSADRQISQGLLSDADVVRSESYLLGFLAGLGYASQVVSVMLDNQEAVAEEKSLTAVEDDDSLSWIGYGGR